MVLFNDMLIPANFDDEIISIEQLQEQIQTVDITTDGNHLFFANGILTHNSGNGQGYAGADISMNNTSESAGINMDADAIFALYQLQGERDLGRLNIKILKNRLGGHVDKTFPMMVDYDTLKMTDWNAEYDDDEYDSLTPTPIKKNTTSTEDEVNKVFQDL